MASPITPTSPMTSLQAVNGMLRAIGRKQVASLLPPSLSEDAATALDVLGQTSVELQSEAWQFNSEPGLPLDPAPDGTIVLPSNIHRLVISGTTRGLNLTQRDGRLYDLSKHTFVIGQTVYADVVFVFPFEELPQPIRHYIFIKAARRFATQKVPTSASYQFSSVDEERAEVAAKHFDVAVEDRSLPEANPHFAGMRRR